MPSSMEQVKDFHGKRIRSLLKTSNSRSTVHGNASSPSPDHSSSSSPSEDGSFHSLAYSNVISPLEIPEIVLLTLKYLPHYSLATLSRVSKFWHDLTQPLVWGTIDIKSIETLEKIISFLPAHTRAVRTMKLGYRIVPDFASHLPKALRHHTDNLFFLNLTSLVCSSIREGKKNCGLIEFLRHCPKLKSLDLSSCTLYQTHPLDCLYECSELESFAFPFPDADENALIDCGQFWPKLKHLRIIGKRDSGDELYFILFQNSFCLESLNLESTYWKQDIITHLITRGHERVTETEDSDQDIKDEKDFSTDKKSLQQTSKGQQRNESAITSLLLGSNSHAKFNFNQVPNLTRLEIKDGGVLDTAFCQRIGSSVCPQLVSLVIKGCVIDDLWGLLSQAKQLVQLEISEIYGVGISSGAKRAGPDWACTGLRELTLNWFNGPHSGEFTDEERSTTRLWTQIGKLKELRTLRLKRCKALRAIEPCPLTILKDLDYLSDLTMPTQSTEEVKEREGQTSSDAAVLAAGATMFQSFKPLSSVCESFCGLHMYPHDQKRQLIAYHYCTMIDEDRRQCLIYDSDEKNAKLLGVEYIISEKLFKELDEDEKKYWHSHKYEVESGALVQLAKSMVPEMVAQVVELKPLQILVNTYGKTWQLWPVDMQGDCSCKVPTGPPQLLVSLTEDGQVDMDLLAKRDARLGISTLKKRQEREGKIKGNPVAAGADQWTMGKPWQIYDLGDKGIVGLKKKEE
ncbi:hypothetical protein BGZ83_004488 [Gryganskiella cystojenkinii]|nr:hypothetical protein BGZ83_004488 [Gryganskiella cystojenkinii]